MSRARRPSKRTARTPSRALALVAAVALLAGIGVLGVRELATARAGATGHRHLHGRAEPSAGAADATSTPPTPVSVDGNDPLATTAVRRLLAARAGEITAAVESLETGAEWVLHRRDREQTASIVKVDILETLLHAHDRSRRSLARVETGTAEQMIEASDNDDATTLWNAVGGSAAIAAYNRRAGLKRTSPNAEGYWGETLTTAADQLTLLRQLALPSKLLSPAARHYQLSLMRHIEAGQSWGVTGGVPARVSVALKNGWLPLRSYSDWQINSIGWVRGDGRDYLIAVLTAHDPGEGYGIDTIERLAADVYRSLRSSGSGSR